MSTLFPTSAFGYAKKEVNEYLSKLNEEFSQKMLEKDREQKKELEALQAEVDRLKEENQVLQALRGEVADAIISAKDYAAALKRQAEADDQAQRAICAAHRQVEENRIQTMAGHVDDLQQEIRGVLERMDRELAAYTEKIRCLQTSAAVQADEQENRSKEGETWGMKTEALP